MTWRTISTQALSQRVAHIMANSVSSSIFNLFILQLNKLFYDLYANRRRYNSFVHYAHFIRAFPSSSVTSHTSDSIKRILFGVTFTNVSICVEFGIILSSSSKARARTHNGKAFTRAQLCRLLTKSDFVVIFFNRFDLTQKCNENLKEWKKN